MEHYLDFAATTPVCIPAADAAYSAMIEHYGNPSSLYRLGLDAENRVATARKTIARALNCEPDCLYFTGSATEANNLAVLGSTAANPRKGKKVITTAIEHAAVLGPFEELGRRGHQTVFLKPEEGGNYSPKQFYDAVDENTALVSVMLVNNEVGTRLPVEEIIRAVRRKNPETLVHVDAVQGAFKLPFSIKTASPDLLSVSGHKLYAPKGIGALYIRKKLRVTPLAIGGGQEHGIRPGTESVPLIEAFAAAVEWYLSHRQEHDETYKVCNAHLRKRLSQMPEVQINTPEGAVPYILNFSVDGIRSEIMLHYLESLGVYVSSGSACSKGEKSHVLKAMGLSDKRADTAIRVSFGAMTSSEDIDALADGIRAGLDTLIRIK